VYSPELTDLICAILGIGVSAVVDFFPSEQF
jgi:hypothetical protein